MKKYIILSALALGMSLASCNDILDRPQLNTPTDESFWNSESDVRLYANSFYTTYFVGYSSGWTSTYTPVRGKSHAAHRSICACPTRAVTHKICSIEAVGIETHVAL